MIQDTAKEQFDEERERQLDVEPCYMGYTYNELNRAFHRVSDPDDWKGPIVDARVEPDDLAVTIAAIGFFTATQVTVEPILDGTMMVNSVGYRMGPAGP